MNKTGNTTKNMVLCAIFIAMSFVLANVKILGTIAFDSLPAFLGVLILGNVYGAAIGAIGHLLTAMLSGFPLGIPVHGIIAAIMAFTVLMYGITFRFVRKRSNFIIAAVCAALVGTLINGPGSVIALRSILLAMWGEGGFWIQFWVLTGAGFANAALALAAYPLIERSRIMQENR